MGELRGTSASELLPPLPDELRCPRCEGDGNYSDLAPCTTFDSNCACNGPRVLVDPCPECGGSGRRKD